MNSIREQILRHIVASLTTAVNPIPVPRSPTVPVTRENSPALLVSVESDSITSHSNVFVDRLLTIKLVAVVRGDDAFDQADQIIVKAHASLMSDNNLGGLAVAVREVDCEWDVEDADAGAIAMPARYEVRYRTHAADLTKRG